jgi:hypothetical protein
MKAKNKFFYLSTLTLALVAVPAFAVGDLPNPIGGGGFVNPQLIISNVIRAILALTGSMALLVFVYGGFNWVMSAGNDEKIQKGKDMMFWASVGLAVIFFSYTLVTTVINAVAGTAPRTSSQQPTGGGDGTSGGGDGTSGGGTGEVVGGSEQD